MADLKHRVCVRGFTQFIVMYVEPYRYKVWTVLTMRFILTLPRCGLCMREKSPETSIRTFRAFSRMYFVTKCGVCQSYVQVTLMI